MSGERRRIEYMVARGPARLLAIGTALVALGALTMLGCLWKWAAILDAPPSMRWLIAGAAGANFVGGMLAMVAFGTVRS